MEEGEQDQEGVHLRNFFINVLERVERDITRIATLEKKLEDGSFHDTENVSQDDEFTVSGTLGTIDLLDSAVQIMCLNVRREDISENDARVCSDLQNVFNDLRKCLEDLHLNFSSKLNTYCALRKLGTGAGRPRLSIPKETLEELRGMNFSWSKIALMFGVSRWTIHRRVEEYGLTHLQKFSDISDDRLDEIILDYISRHGPTTGEPYISGYLRSIGIHVQRRRVRSSINRVDPRNTVLRWGALVSRRTYSVPWPNSLWHLDGHHSLIRWKFVIHGCIDGKSRKIIFLKCSTNNLASTVLSLFLKGIDENWGLWPSRVRVDYGIENVSVCDAMIVKRGYNRGSFIAGSSTRNQRIERLWRDVFRCVAMHFYYTFYAMEQTGVLDVENSVHLFALHLVYLERINRALDEFKGMFNEHKLSTEEAWTPNQLWYTGMVDEENPLGIDEVEDSDYQPENIVFYGEEIGGPVAFEDSQNEVVVSPLNIPFQDEIQNYVYQNVDPNTVSQENGIDIYISTLQHVVQKLTMLGD